jgi:hypothetical protein
MVARVVIASRFLVVVTLAFLLGACGKSFTPAEVNRAYDAAARGDAVAMQKELNQGFDPNYYYWDRGYLIDEAATARNTGALAVLIQAGARVNVQVPGSGANPLIISVFTDRCESARLLFKAGARKDFKFIDAGAMAAAELDGFTAPEIYQKYRTENPKAFGTKCWSEVGRMLLAPSNKASDVKESR